MKLSGKYPLVQLTRVLSKPYRFFRLLTSPCLLCADDPERLLGSSSSDLEDDVPNTLPIARVISPLGVLPTVEIVLTIARHSRSIMERTKQTCHRAPPYDLHIPMLVTRGSVGIVEEVAQPQYDRYPGANEAKKPMAGRQYKTCVVFPNNPLCFYDEVRWPLNSLGHLSERRNILRFACEANFRKYGQYPPKFNVEGVEGPSGGPDDVPIVEVTCLRGTTGDAILLIRPRGHGLARPTCPLPTSRGNGKATVSDSSSDDSSSEDDGRELYESRMWTNQVDQTVVHPEGSSSSYLDEAIASQSMEEVAGQPADHMVVQSVEAMAGQLLGNPDATALSSTPLALAHE
uniref:Uncharacterized protein n=1 Tax=Cannabis sativa TaxID=3483 RepID=A0A803P563_CANSA